MNMFRLSKGFNFLGMALENPPLHNTGWGRNQLSEGSSAAPRMLL
jgi:hypothetical protein